ncbi:hypothetical protein EC844_12619 [Acinetobacter calcoaceticus]|uniref:Uncharacterized protein n=1 Tax=Acinetobacter calcoaceticus TaxID=471 RepID=A0A4R1XJN0_ACICA|nr:hypothetical protein EC844_12619 [Acinetobacter calcoaceticus]
MAQRIVIEVPGTKISELDRTSKVTAKDFFPVVQDDETKQAPLEQVANLIVAGLGSAAMKNEIDFASPASVEAVKVQSQKQTDAANERIDGVEYGLKAIGNGADASFSTYTEMVAYIPAKANVSVRNNDPDLELRGTYIWDGKGYKKGYDSFDQSVQFANKNPLFKPVRLDASTIIDELTTAGIYHVPQDPIAKSLGLPSALHGQLTVSGYTQPPKSGFVFQTFMDRAGGVFFRTKEAAGWSVWNGNTYQVISPSNTNLDLIIIQGNYNIRSAVVKDDAEKRNYPFFGVGSSGELAVQYSREHLSSINQTVTSSQGVASRVGSLKGDEIIWQPWSGVRYENNSIKNVSTLLEIGQVNQKIIKDMSDLNGHLDKAIVDGLYQVNTGSVASRANGFPIVATGGFLTVKRNASAAIHQVWETYGGYAFRWGSLSGDSATWQPWRGFKNSANSIIDVSQQITEQKLIVYGSSTLEYLSDELADLAKRKNLVFKDKSLSGETVNGAGFVMGANEVSVSFPSGIITNGKNVVLLQQIWSGRDIHKTTQVELSNGIVGSLTYNATEKKHVLTISGLSKPLIITSSIRFNTIAVDWYNQIDGVMIINIGKNNVGYDSLETILANTKAFLDYLPKDSKFIVGGHFSNTNATDSTRDIVEEINAFLESNYGLKYFDINKLLFEESTWTRLGLTKTNEDIAAIERRCKPPSLSRDAGHMSAEMDVILAEEIERTLLRLKYI